MIALAQKSAIAFHLTPTIKVKYDHGTIRKVCQITTKAVITYPRQQPPPLNQSDQKRSPFQTSSKRLRSPINNSEVNIISATFCRLNFWRVAL
ncbi:hypothetical protein [Tolypothrix sp. VBCCA 56010]|uniref:hypothetical protein n=1 Tax=Tolypothrix sp. VBCCA 56010 TaxID=3137731 RepID=UPI003D7D5C00